MPPTPDEAMIKIMPSRICRQVTVMSLSIITTACRSPLKMPTPFFKVSMVTAISLEKMAPMTAKVTTPAKVADKQKVIALATPVKPLPTV